MTILVNTPFVHAEPFKTLVDVDISGESHSRRVEIIPSEAYPGGIHYTANHSYRHTHILGTVRDGDEVLVEGDPTAMSRYILVHPRGDGMVYIRVITRWRILANTFRNHVDEFKRGPIDAHYMPVARVPIEVDVLTQDVGPYINVELLGNWEEHDRRPGVMPDNIEEMPILFTIQPEMNMVVTIGVVKYGHYILENEVHGLLYREVIWEGGPEKPIITITSRYNDGNKIERTYGINTYVGVYIRRSNKKHIKFFE